MAAPILWTPRISVFFLQETLHIHKIPRCSFRGGGYFGFGGGECRFYFYGRGDFSEKRASSQWIIGPHGVCKLGRTPRCESATVWDDEVVAMGKSLDSTKEREP